MTAASDEPNASVAVAVDVTPMVGPRTGIGTFTAELVAALGRLDGAPRIVPYVLSRRARLGSTDLPDSTRRLPIPAAVAVRLWGRFDFPGFDGRLGPATVVHGTNYVVPPVRRRGAVVTVHDCAFARFPEMCSPVTRAYGAVVRRAIRRGAWVHTPTEHVAGEVRELFGTDRVRAIPHGVPHLDPGGGPGAPSPVEGPFLLVLGTLEPRKRPELAVETFGRLAPERTDLRLVLAGSDGPARPAVDAAVAALPHGVAGRVVVLGRVDAPTRSALLHHATGLLQVSRYEGFGLPLLEAMRAGTPVVTTPGGGALAEVAGDAALVVDGGADDLAGAVTAVLDDGSLHARLVEAGYLRAEGFTWPGAAERFRALYEEVAHG